MPIHPSLPQTLTKENLAKWITENCIDKKMHEEKIDLDEKEIQELEHKSSNASRQIDALTRLQKEIVGHIVDGTTEPVKITVPFTKGLKALKANREFADNCIELGFTKEETVLYAIPYPEKDVVIFVDSEGVEYPFYQESMTPEQSKSYNTMFKEPSLQEQVSKKQKEKKSAAQNFHDGLAEAGMKVTGVEGNTVTIETGLTKKEKKTLGGHVERVAPKGDLPPSDIGGDEMNDLLG